MDVSSSPLPSKETCSWRKVLAVLGVFPLLLFLFHVSGLVQTEPIYYHTGLSAVVKSQLLEGDFGIELNIVATSLDLGRRAAVQVLNGQAPLWNHFEGFGQPLLGEMQAAALFPPTLLLLLPHGQALEHCLLQFLAGIGAYLFFRKYGVGPQSALLGGILFEMNGVFTWLQNAIFNPVAFLPWLFYSIEGLSASARKGDHSRTARFAALGGIAGALALYGGFPEEVYLYGLLLAAWIIFRLKALPPHGARTCFLSGLAAAAGLGLMLAAPLLVAFLDFLPFASLGDHSHDVPSGALGLSPLLKFLLPYADGPILAPSSLDVQLQWMWIGGYIGLTPVLCAAAFFFSRRLSAIPPAERLLGAWLLLAIAATINLPVISTLFRLVPFVSITFYQRYLSTGWIFCAIFLTVLYLEQLGKESGPVKKSGVYVALGAGLLVAGLLLAHVPLLEKEFSTEKSDLGQASLISSAGLAALVIAAFAYLTRRPPAKGAALGLAALLVGEAAIFSVVPLFSYQRSMVLFEGSVAFLQKSLGLQRVVNFGSTILRPNVGSYYGISELNYYDLPVPQATIDYTRSHLDEYASTTTFRMNSFLTGQSDDAHRREALERLDNYAAAGVKYVIARPKEIEDAAAKNGIDISHKLTLRYKDDLTEVFELAHPTAYFRAPDCQVTPIDYDHAETDCAKPSSLARQELYMPGWSATVDGKEQTVTKDESIFQVTSLPKGHSAITFRFIPPGFTSASIAALTALCILLLTVTLTFATDRRRLSVN